MAEIIVKVNSPCFNCGVFHITARYDKMQSLPRLKTWYCGCGELLAIPTALIEVIPRARLISKLGVQQSVGDSFRPRRGD